MTVDHFDFRDWPRLGPAWAKMFKILEDGEWHSKHELCEAAMESGIVYKTAGNMLRQATSESMCWLESRRTKDRLAGRPKEYRFKVPPHECRPHE